MADEQGERPDKQRILDQINDAFLHGAVPHNAALGLRAVDCGRGHATLQLPYDPKLVGNPETGVLHGGAITSLIDAAGGLSIFMRFGEPKRVATLDLRIDYLKPATPERDVRARADCYKVTRHVAFVRAVAFHDDDADPIAASAGTFMIFGEENSPVAEKMKHKGT